MSKYQFECTCVCQECTSINYFSINCFIVSFRVCVFCNFKRSNAYRFFKEIHHRTGVHDVTEQQKRWLAGSIETCTRMTSYRSRAFFLNFYSVGQGMTTSHLCWLDEKIWYSNDNTGWTIEPSNIRMKSRGRLSWTCQLNDFKLKASCVG